MEEVEVDWTQTPVTQIWFRVTRGWACAEFVFSLSLLLPRMHADSERHTLGSHDMLLPCSYACVSKSCNGHSLSPTSGHPNLLPD